MLHDIITEHVLRGSVGSLLSRQLLQSQAPVSICICKFVYLCICGIVLHDIITEHVLRGLCESRQLLQCQPPGDKPSSQFGAKKVNLKILNIS